MSLVLICLLGLALIVYSRYERQHPGSTGQPTIGTRWYAALSVDICGKQSSLAANPTSKPTPGITTDGAGVIAIAPTRGADAGANATLGRFVQSYRGLKLSSSELKLPGTTTYQNGGTCPAGTPDAHKRAYVRVQEWPSYYGTGASHPVTVSDPSSLKLANTQLITVAYVPTGASIPKPGSEAITAMLDLLYPPTTTTTTPSTTTAPSTTTTTTATPSSTNASTTTTKP
jgi:hypothetical protein